MKLSNAASSNEAPIKKCNRLLSESAPVGVTENGTVVSLPTWFMKAHVRDFAGGLLFLGGEFTRVALHWLDWHLKGNEEASKLFLDRDSELRRDPRWTVELKNFPAAKE